jgi:hypothetical protein
MDAFTSARVLAAAAALALLLTACGGSSGGSTPTTTPTSSASVDGPTAPTGPAARQVKGYTIAPASEAAKGTFEALVTGSQGAFKNLSAYKVAKGSTEVGGLVIFDVDPTVVIGPEAAETLTTALVKTLSGQSTVTSRMFGGLRVVTATADGTTVSAWFNGDVTSVVIGADAAAIKAFVDASIVG